MRVSGHRFFSASVAGATISKQRFWQIAMLSAAGTVAAAPHADAAALFYWQDSDPGDTRPRIEPQLPAPLSATAYFANQDPVLAGALRTIAANLSPR